MKTKFFLLTLLLLPLCLLHGQSYGKLEKRFSKEKPTHEDSIAFRAQAMQKVQSLFYKSELYERNTGNLSNQSYIAQSLPEMFYVEEGDTLDLKPMLGAIAKIQNAKPKQNPQFEFTDQDGYLGKIETTNTKPKMSFLVSLMKAPKRFGQKEELIWQVFLLPPKIE